MKSTKHKYIEDSADKQNDMGDKCNVDNKSNYRNSPETENNKITCSLEN